MKDVTPIKKRIADLQAELNAANAELSEALISNAWEKCEFEIGDKVIPVKVFGGYDGKQKEKILPQAVFMGIKIVYGRAVQYCHKLKKNGVPSKVEVPNYQYSELRKP